MRLQIQHIKNDAKQNWCDKIAVVKWKIEPMSTELGNLKNLRTETKSALKQLKDFRNVSKS